MTRKTPPDPLPLVVSPRQAAALLGVGRTYLYELMGNGSLSFYKEGSATRVTLDSINRHIASRLAESGGRKGRCNAHKRP